MKNNRKKKVTKKGLPGKPGESITYLINEEVCHMLRMSGRTLQRLRSHREITYYKIGGKVLYQRDDIIKMMNKKKYSQ